VWSTGITLLELVQNRYPFPEDLTTIELLVYITQGDVSSLSPHFISTAYLCCQPPQLVDEPDGKWTDEMKDFIKQTYVVFQRVFRNSFLSLPLG